MFTIARSWLVREKWMDPTTVSQPRCGRQFCHPSIAARTANGANLAKEDEASTLSLESGYFLEL